MSGAVYVFERGRGGPNNWGQTTRLVASDAAAGDVFGFSVAISGDTVIVGAPTLEGTGAGAAYVLERNLGGLNQWGERKKLTPGDSRVGDFFGLAVEIDGDTAVVVGDGTAYVFERHLGGVDNWGQRKKLRARDSSADNGLFGSVALSGNRILLGARLNDDAGDNSGAAYVFARNRGGPNNWGEVRKLVPADAASGDQFGLSVALFGDRAVVGAQLNDDPDTSTGSGYVFARNRGGVDQWGQRAKLAGRDTAGFDLFGWSVALSGQTAVVGSIRNDAACSPFDPRDAGAAYIFDLTAAPQPSQGHGPLPPAPRHPF